MFIIRDERLFYKSTNLKQEKRKYNSRLIKTVQFGSTSGPFGLKTSEQSFTLKEHVLLLQY